MEHLSPEELARYSRQIILPGFGPDAQQRLKQARVLVIGMGGLGSPASLYLAAAGVGTLGLADYDRVDLSNLHRQILHSSDDLGRLKLDSARRRISDLNPHCTLRSHSRGVRAELLPELFADYDVIVDGSDNFPTRYMVNDAAVLAGKPLVYGSIFQFEGQASFFHPAGGAPCYRCLFPRMPDPGSVPNCAEAGVLGALCGMIGSIQAMEAIKCITGIGTTLAGRLLRIDALTMQTRTLALKRDPECPVCSAKATIRSINEQNYDWSCSPDAQMEHPNEVSAREVHKMLDGENPPILLDVRQPYEAEIATLPDSVLIPLRDLPGRAESLPKDQRIIAYCHHGMRSLAAVKELKSHGFKNVSSMRGGIEAWSKEVDPSIQRY